MPKINELTVSVEFSNTFLNCSFLIRIVLRFGTNYFAGSACHIARMDSSSPSPSGTVGLGLFA
jgi:hypothetical protein